jgi:hypothetical protein
MRHYDRVTFDLCCSTRLGLEGPLLISKMGALLV